MKRHFHQPAAIAAALLSMTTEFPTRNYLTSLSPESVRPFRAETEGCPISGHERSNLYARVQQEKKI